MKLKKIRNVVVLFFLTISGFSQTQPFPANKVFGYGLMATTRNSSDALSNYTTWKSNFLSTCSNGRYRVKFDTASQTVSEGIGYGMLLTVYAGDRTIFDGLWNYYKDNRNTNGVMNWKIDGCSGVLGQNGATDAELDVAMALIVADFQWGSAGTVDYKSDAVTLIGSIKSKEIELSTQVLKPGDAWGGSTITNPSYFAPGYCRAFGKFTNDTAFWDLVASKCYTILNNNLTKNNAVGGLVSDWCQADGAYSSQSSNFGNQGKAYSYDAARTPWRIAVDYVWYGTPEAKAYIKKASDFVRVTLGGTANIKDGYYQSGTLLGQWHNSTFVGAFATAAMGGDDQSHLDASYSDIKNINDSNSYFNQTLKTLYLFLLNGDFYLPSNATLDTGSFQKDHFDVTLYPNPSSGIFTIIAPIQSQIKVIDAQGKILLEKKMSSNSLQLNLKDQTAGIYMIHIKNEGIVEVKKIILN
jgi:endo-1,4-beta-D-glucanase Y